MFAKNRFLQAAINSGYSELAIFRPEIKSWIIPKLDEGTYQEKQVDTNEFLYFPVKQQPDLHPALSVLQSKLLTEQQLLLDEFHWSLRRRLLEER